MALIIAIKSALIKSNIVLAVLLVWQNSFDQVLQEKFLFILETRSSCNHHNKKKEELRDFWVLWYNQDAWF